MRSSAVPNPDVIAVVDHGYARDFDHWVSTVRKLSDLPDDPTLCVLIRVKSLNSSELEHAAQRARRAFKNQSVMLSWNGDSNIATTYGFDACHQPQADICELDESAAHLAHSASIHDQASLRKAESCGVDFVVFGPVFEPHWKAVEAQGLDELTRIVAMANVPVVAIGGVNSDSLTSIPKTGACGVASLSGVMEAADPVDALLTLQSEWRECIQAGSRK